MDLSGVVLACWPEHLADIKNVVRALPWATVHHEDEQGRLVIVIEAEDSAQSQARLLELQRLSHVLSAQLAAYLPSETFGERRNIQ